MHPLADHPYDDRALHAYLQQLLASPPSPGDRPDMAEVLVGPLILMALVEDGPLRIRRLQAELGDLLLAQGADAGWLWEDIHRSLTAVAAEGRFRSLLHHSRVMGLLEDLFVELAAGPPGLDAVRAMPWLGDDVSTLQLASRGHYWVPECQVALVGELLRRAPDAATRKAHVVTLAEWGWAALAELWVESTLPPARVTGARLVREEFGATVGTRFARGYPLPDPTRRLPETGPGCGRWFPRPTSRDKAGAARDALPYFEPRHPCAGCGKQIVYPASKTPLGVDFAERMPFYHHRRLADIELHGLLDVLRPRELAGGAPADCPSCAGSGRLLDAASCGEAADLSGPCLSCCDWEVALDDPFEIAEVLRSLDQILDEAAKAEPAVQEFYRVLNARRDAALPLVPTCEGCDAPAPPIHACPLDADVIVAQGLRPVPGGKA